METRCQHKPFQRHSILLRIDHTVFLRNRIEIIVIQIDMSADCLQISEIFTIKDRIGIFLHRHRRFPLPVDENQIRNLFARGLIKGYGWLNPETLTIDYATNGMPDLGANQMYYSASVSGPIDTMPDTPGLAVWHDGHIGVYIGNGEVIEAMGTKYGVVKTKLEGRGWTHWLEIEYINYN